MSNECETKRKLIIFRVPPDLYEQLREWAQREERSVNAQMVYAVRRMLAVRDEEMRMNDDDDELAS